MFARSLSFYLEDSENTFRQGDKTMTVNSEEVIETVGKRKEEKMENVILLSMSTLPDKVKQNEFKFEAGEEERIFYGKSQLSPDTKTILSILDAKGQAIDRIVILATKEAQEEKEISLVDGEGEEISKKITDAVSFFEEEILDYIAKCKENSEDREYCLKNLSLTREQFVVVDLDEYAPENTEEVLYDAVKAIKGDNNKEINLYINMQGGIRSTMMKMNAITELLESQNVKIVGRYANNYNGREPQPYKSVSVADDYRPYELVTAMTIFKKYGRGEKLLEYFSDTDKFPFAKKLAEAIKLAADSIQLCDVDGFDKAIETIQDIDKIYDESNASPTLKIIYQDIKGDYDTILNAEHKYVSQIRWCLKKGFLQQAMTILESKMPDEYVRSGILYFCKSNQKQEVLAKLVNIYENEYAGKSTDKDGNLIDHKDSYLMKNVNHFFINSMVGQDETSKTLFIRKKFKKYKLKIFYGKTKDNFPRKTGESYATYKMIRTIRNEMNHAQSKNNNNGFYSQMLEKRANEPAGSRIYEIFEERKRKSSQDVIDMINKYLDEWEALAEQVPAQVKANVADIS